VEAASAALGIFARKLGIAPEDMAERILPDVLSAVFRSVSINVNP
jgi:hypothetical protein